MKNKFKLTKEEREIENSLNDKDWVVAPDSLQKEIIASAQKGLASKKREARTNIRIMQTTLQLIQQKAKEEGLGYQTLMSSVLHKYATGKLIEKSALNSLATELLLKFQNQRSISKKV